MALFSETRNRLIIPRWREYKRDFFSFEHLPYSGEVIEFQNMQDDEDFLLKEQEWKQSNSIPAAIELVNAATSLDLQNKSLEAALILKTQENLPKPLFKMVQRVLGEGEINNTDTFFENFQIQSFFKFIGQKVNRLRKRLIDYPNNALLWLELARLHSILGNNLKAEDCLSIAHSLSNRINRAITRACSRFYYHIGDNDRAHEIIRQSPLIRNDPWMMSAEISYSIKRNRFSPNVKKGIGLIESKHFSPFEISELASIIGTIEYFNGSNKNAKKFFQTSLLDPNDNSLAQAEWVSREIGNVGFYNWLEKVDYAFEARAHEYLYNKKYKESLQEGFNWVVDQPFSKRAIQFSSYVASALVNDQESAIQICTIGLRSNSASFEIVNNLVYAYALKGQIKEARTWLVKMESLIGEEKHKIFLLANEGLIHFREKQIERGREKYNEAMQLADKLKEMTLKSTAQLNLMREEYLSAQISEDQVVSIIQKIAKNKNFTVNAEFEAILGHIKNYKAPPVL
jgi:hypothetical protein